MKHDNVKIDFCPHCRRKIDWAIETLPWKKIYIKATEGAGPPTQHTIIRLCETCGKFVSSALKVDGFTIHTP